MLKQLLKKYLKPIVVEVIREEKKKEDSFLEKQIQSTLTRIIINTPKSFASDVLDSDKHSSESFKRS